MTGREVCQTLPWDPSHDAQHRRYGRNPAAAVSGGYPNNLRRTTPERSSCRTIAPLLSRARLGALVYELYNAWHPRRPDPRQHELAGAREQGLEALPNRRRVGQAHDAVATLQQQPYETENTFADRPQSAAFRCTAVFSEHALAH